MKRQNPSRRFMAWRRKPSRFQFRLRQAMFVLPNLFTLSSILCGVWAISRLLDPAAPNALYEACLAVLFGMFFDGIDGRVARLTKTQSEFGVQLDSLADVITFGVVPSIILYRWGLEPLGFFGLILAFIYVACGAVRLARFNVMAARNVAGSSTFFMGLPIPFAGGAAISAVMLDERVFSNTEARLSTVVILVSLLSYLMVSTIRYRSFKQSHPNRRFTLVALSLLVVLGVLSYVYHPSVALALLAVSYISLGIIEEIWSTLRKNQQQHKLQQHIHTR